MLTPSDRAELSRLLTIYRAELTAEVNAADTSKQDDRFLAHFASHAALSAGELLRRLESAR